MGILDIVTVLLVTIGPLKALIVYATLMAKADADFQRQVAIKTVTTATIVTLVFVVAGEILLEDLPCLPAGAEDRRRYHPAALRHRHGDGRWA